MLMYINIYRKKYLIFSNMPSTKGSKGTMADNLMYIPNDDIQHNPYCRIRETFKHSTSWFNQSKVIKVPRVTKKANAQENFGNKSKKQLIEPSLFLQPTTLLQRILGHVHVYIIVNCVGLSSTFTEYFTSPNENKDFYVLRSRTSDKINLIHDDMM